MADVEREHEHRHSNHDIGGRLKALRSFGTRRSFREAAVFRGHKIRVRVL